MPSGICCDIVMLLVIAYVMFTVSLPTSIPKDSLIGARRTPSVAKEKKEDTWDNVKATKYNQRTLKRQRKKRMQELNTKNENPDQQ